MTFIAGMFAGGFIGWVWAHYSIADECEKLGGFFVGKKVYRCTSTPPAPGTEGE